MARVFLSYSRDDAAAAQSLADAIATAGHEVWWDRHIHGGSRFASEIDRELKNAEAVVVLWSDKSVDSAWVQDEAVEGRDTGRLIPVLLDKTKPPLGFRQFQCVDLSQWDRLGEPNLPGELLKAIARMGGVRPVTDSATAAKLKARPKPSICVLPFANMSDEPEQEYFSDGISEDIITDLSKISALSVVARNAAFTFKGVAVDVPRVAHQLNVGHVLEGSVRKSGSRVRITAQLIDGTAGDHVWGERYDRDLTDVFAIQDEISQAIVKALKLKLLPDEKKAIENRGTASAEAYDLYLMARQYWITGNHGDRRREETVVRICRRAIEIDPDYARAWALMAIAQSNLRYAFEGGEDAEDGVAAAERALALDPGIAEAHCPKARHLAERNRFEEADAEIATALRLDPDSWEVNKEAGRILIRQRRIDEATPYFEKAVAVMETDFHAWGLLFSCYQAQGKSDDAIWVSKMVLKQAERVLAQDPDNGSALSLGATSLAVLGQPERAKQWLERALLVDPDNLNIRYNFVCNLLVYFHDSDAALDMLEPVFAVAGKPMIKLVEGDVDLDSLRDNPRYQSMLADARKRLGEQTSS